MSNQRRTQFRRMAASPLIAACAAVLVALALVLPVLAVEGSTKLLDPSVSARTGTTATTITFTVVYRNREGSAADYVKVVIDGTAHLMASDGTSDWHDGVPHHWSGKLPVGAHAVRFDAAGRDKFTDTISGGSVTIEGTTSPTPTPRPTPRPTPEPTPTPTPASPEPGGGSGATPTPTPPPDAGTGGTGGSGGTDPGATPPDDSPLAGGSTTNPDDPTDGLLGGTAALGGNAGSGGAGSGGDAPGHPGWVGWTAPGDGSAPADPGGPDANQTPTTGGGTGSGSGAGAGSGSETPARGDSDHGAAGGPGWGALATALETLGIDQSPSVTVLPMLVGTTGAMSMAFAFAIFGKKRRDEAPPAPDEVLQANAARGVGAVPGGEVAGVVRSIAIPAPLDLEAGMPRWRRPSLQAARKADPARSVAINQPMTFDSGIVAAVDGRERRVIRYAVVRLLDAPDELRSAEIGQLDQGDEVQLIERSGAYWLVLCPNGQQGWLHKMTLGEVVSDAAPTYARDVDEDVLGAFLAARARA